MAVGVDEMLAPMDHEAVGVVEGDVVGLDVGVVVEVNAVLRETNMFLNSAVDSA